MSEQHQPECPADFADIKEGATVVHVSNNGEPIRVGVVTKAAHLSDDGNCWIYSLSGEPNFMCKGARIFPSIEEYYHYLEAISAHLAEAEARVKELEAENKRLVFEDKDLNAIILLETAAHYKALEEILTLEAKLARVKSLLDGVGPVVKLLKGLHTLAIDGKWVAKGGAVQEIKNTHGNHIASDISSFDASFIVEARNSLPAMLSAISEVREVLKGE